MVSARTGKALGKWRGSDRDPRYVVTALFGLAAFIFITLQVTQASALDAFDTHVFRIIFGWPQWLFVPFYIITQLGTISSVLLWAALALYIRNMQLAFSVLVAGTAGWLIAKPLKLFVDRGIFRI